MGRQKSIECTENSADDISMNTAVPPKLVLAKNFYSRALQNIQGQGALGRMVAIHHFHIAIEITLRSIVSHYEIEGYSSRSGFVDLIGLIKKDDRFKAEVGRIPHEDRIKTINNRRNDVQHNHIDPSKDQALTTGIDSALFLNSVFERVFGLDFDSVDELSLVKSDLLTRLLVAAKENCRNNDYEKSRRCSAVAFQLSLDYLSRENDSQERYGFSRHLRGFQAEARDAHNFGRGIERMAEKVDENAGVISLLFAGVDMQSYSRYVAKAPTFSFASSGLVHFSNWRVPESDEDDVRFAIDFAISTAVLIQSDDEPESFTELIGGLERSLQSEVLAPGS